MKKSPNNKHWNVMVYMAGEKSLSEECIFSLKEMYRVGTAPAVNVVVQFHSDVKDAVPRRYKIKPQPSAKKIMGGLSLLGDDDGELNNPDNVEEVLTLPGTPSVKPSGRKATPKPLKASDPAVLMDFLHTSIDKQPDSTARQMVIISGHASGAVGDFLGGQSMSLDKLRGVFEAITENLKGKKIDIVMMDSCLMSMAEVAYELRNTVELLIGAEGFELSTGWPYHRILDTLNTEGADDSETLACSLVSKYVRYYSDYDVAGVSVDQSVCNLALHQELADAVAVLAKVLIKGVKDSATLNRILLAHWRAQSYNAEQYVDLWDFCQQLIENGVNDDIRAACEAVQLVIKGNPESKEPTPFVIHSCYSGAAFQNSNGVSIYLPWAADSRKVGEFPPLKQYKGLEFHDNTKWGTFVETYLKTARRKVRNLNPDNEKELLCFIPTDETRVGVRATPPTQKGGSGRAVKMKNPPVEFLREPCL